MNEEKTCLVLGAGASHPYWFPLGCELKRFITDESLRLHFGKNVQPFETARFLMDAGFAEAEVRRFQKTLGGSPQDTIDRFLELRNDFVAIGKLTIAAVMAHIARHCDFDNLRSGSGGEHLYRLLYKIVFPHPPRSNNSLRIVTFNYDLSLETYLAQGLVADTSLSEDQAWDAVMGLHIEHVHGCMPKRISWPLKIDEIRLAATGIKVIYETNSESDERLGRIRSKVQHSDRIIFLGFGYDERNIRLLDIRDDWPPNSMGIIANHPPPPQKTVFGTCFGLRDSQIKKARSRFSVSCEISAQHRDWDATRFILETGLLD
jgi:hypothetical protein